MLTPGLSVLHILLFRSSKNLEMSKVSRSKTRLPDSICARTSMSSAILSINALFSSTIFLYSIRVSSDSSSDITSENPITALSGVRTLRPIFSKKLEIILSSAAFPESSVISSMVSCQLSLLIFRIR